ncbi:30S ribosomal protein S19e [Candidatus Parvarchaeota archaeon]|nr:30S ribosomal protein S19e [Candidatus Parvarchaeota archaeon]
MVTVYDIKPNMLIEATAKKLKELGIAKPSYIDFVKSGPDKMRLAQSGDFFFVRCASLLRQAYVNELVGVNSLRTHYGGRKNRGVKPEKHRDASGSIIRRGFQQLEKLGLIEKKKVGRGITGKGKKLLDSVARELAGQNKAA